MHSKNFLFVTSIVLVSFLYSCTNERALQPNLEIKNEDLRSAIIEYDSLLRTTISDCDSSLMRLVSTNNYLLTVFERPLNDTVTQFSISVSLGTWNLQDCPVSLAKVNNRDVLFYLPEYGHGVVATDGQFHKDITRKYFPEEYGLLETRRTLLTSWNNDVPWMELRFCKNKLVQKRLPIVFRGDGTVVPLK